MYGREVGNEENKGFYLSADDRYKRMVRQKELAVLKGVRGMKDMEDMKIIKEVQDEMAKSMEEHNRCCPMMFHFYLGVKKCGACQGEIYFPKYRSYYNKEKSLQCWKEVFKGVEICRD